MVWARVWVQFMRILNILSNVGDTVILMIASRMVRDSEELRRRALSRILANGFHIIDMLLTMMFLFLGAFILDKSKDEIPTMPLRFWIVVFMLYCMFHILFSIVQYEGGPWSQASATRLRFSNLLTRNLEYKKNAFGIFWWGLGMFFMVKGADQMYIAAPNLTWVLIFFLCFDITLAICCMLFLVFAIFSCCIPILCVAFYYARDQENKRRIQLPPCPWCHNAHK